jgi:hypothetical protein
MGANILRNRPFRQPRKGNQVCKVIVYNAAVMAIVSFLEERMYSTVLPDTIESSIQSMYWILLAIFFVLTTLGWLAATRLWRDEEIAAENHKEQNEDGQTSNG